jgi:hypothetical protein
MALDQTKVGQHITAQMEALEADYGDECEIGDLCTIVEVVGPHGSHVRVRSSDLRPHVIVGLLRTSEEMLVGAMRGGTPGNGNGLGH